MTEMSKSGPKQCPSEKVDCRTLFPIIDSSFSCDSVAVKKQFHLDNTHCQIKRSCITRAVITKATNSTKTVKNRLLEIMVKGYLHALSACGASERLGGVANFGLGGVLTFDLTLLGLGDEGFGGTATESSVKELVCYENDRDILCYMHFYLHFFNH